MAASLKKLNNLEILNLGDCLLKSGGTQLICKALKGRHPKLKELILDSNEIRLKGGLNIVEAIVDKKQLVKLGINGNQFGENGLSKILKKFEEIGLKDLLEEVEDNEEPDSDEEDPDVSSDDEDNGDETVKNNQAKGPFSFGSAATPSQGSLSIFGGTPKSSNSVFGGSPAASSSSFGGASSNSRFKPSGNIFNSPKPAAENSIFGNPPSRHQFLESLLSHHLCSANLVLLWNLHLLFPSQSSEAHLIHRNPPSDLLFSEQHHQQLKHRLFRRLIRAIVQGRDCSVKQRAPTVTLTQRLLTQCSGPVQKRDLTSHRWLPRRRAQGSRRQEKDSSSRERGPVCSAARSRARRARRVTEMTTTTHTSSRKCRCRSWSRSPPGRR